MLKTRENDNMYTLANPFSDTSQFTGLTEQEAKGKAVALGLVFRVTRRDGEHYYFVTADYASNRVNAHISDGKVVSCHVG
jgi:hypothetical protein